MGLKMLFSARKMQWELKFTFKIYKIAWTLEYFLSLERFMYDNNLFKNVNIF